jgi:hypothetical protein
MLLWRENDTQPGGTAVITARTTTDLGQLNGSLPRVLTELSPDARSAISANPSDRQGAGLAARKIESDSARLCPAVRLQWLYGL